LTWPKEYGGLARPPIDQLIYSEEFTYRDAPVVNAIGWGLAAGALLRGGTQAQKQKSSGCPSISPASRSGRCSTSAAAGRTTPSSTAPASRTRT
jgi:alkylation response protein AidB-like acyl-CoA dehydrogenase